MRIVITTIQAPFVSGGAELLASGLKRALINAGHIVEIVTIPFMDQPIDKIEDHIIISRLIEIENTWAGHTDLCIGLKFPAYYIPHTNKVCWVLHQHRAAYDLFNTEYSNIKDNIEGNRIKKIIENSDIKYLSESKRIYTISKNVSRRMKQYTGVNSKPLYHPCPDMDKYFADSYEDYILMPSRINITKRQKLAIEALSKTKSNISLYIVGKADNEANKKELLELCRKSGIQNRVRFFDYVSQEEKLRLYSKARAVLFIPLDEDYGYITLEAMAASRAVITASDSGGTLEFVIDGKTGRICNPNPKELSEAIDEVAKSPDISIEMGKAARMHLMEMDISWENVVRELTK